METHNSSHYHSNADLGFDLQVKNHLKLENFDQLMPFNYWGKTRKPAIKTSLRAANVSPVKRVLCNAYQVFDEMSERDEKKKLLLKFRVLCRLLREEEGKCKKQKRVDQEAWNVIKFSGQLPKFIPLFGPIPGVNVGDEFEFRFELMLVGLHSSPVHGIDYGTGLNGVIMASSVVANEEYWDVIVETDLLIYIGEGGAFGKDVKDVKDQELKRGNLAMKNSIDEGNFVRVIRGIKSKGGSKRSIYVYDGLYKVVDWCKTNGPYGKLVFKFELRRCPGQKAIVWEKY